MPNQLPKDVYIYLFISDQNVLEKIHHQLEQYSRQVEVVNIKKIVKQNQAKNAMDFCIVSQLGNLLHVLSRKQKVIIVSKDKGYDAAIEFMKLQFPNHHIERYPLSMYCYYTTNPYAQRILKQCHQELLKRISTYQTMQSLKKSLTKSEKSIFIIDEYVEEISGVKIFIEFDIYLNQFALYHSGNVKKRYQTLEEVNEDYCLLMDNLQKKYQKYYSRELLVKAKQMNIHPYIEEAYLKNETLQKCLVNHFGQNEGVQLFNQFIHSS